MIININALELKAAAMGLNLSQLADRAKVSRQTVSTIKGRRTCKATTLHKLATALEIDPAELLEEK